MSEVSPPTENVPIFNPIYFQPSAGGTDVAFLNANYLKFPVSQNSQELFSSGLATLNNVVFSSGNIATERQITGINLLEFEPVGSGGTGQITFPDGTIQNTAFSGSGGSNLTPNSINITSTQSPQDATTAITNLYNNNSAYSINNLFLNWNPSGTKQYRQNMGKIMWNTITPDSANIYLNMTFEWTFNFIPDSNSFAQPSNQHPSFYSRGTFAFCPYWVQYYATNQGIPTMTAEQDSNNVYISWINTQTGSPVSGGWSINPKITLEWNASAPTEMIVYYLNQSFSSGGSSGFVENGRVDLNVKCLTKGGLPVGDPTYNDFYMEFDPTFLTGYIIP